MSCSIVGKPIRVQLEPSDTRFSLLFGSGRFNATRRSALQNPELSRYELDCLIRHNQSKLSPAEGWMGLMAMSQAACANSNDS